MVLSAPIPRDLPSIINIFFKYKRLIVSINLDKVPGNLMYYIAFACYALSFLLQAVAGFISISLAFRMSGVYRWAWISLSSGLILMLSRSAIPLFEIHFSGHYHIADALFSFFISLLLLCGIYGIAGLVKREKIQNDAMVLITATDPLTHCLSRTEIFFRVTEEIDRTLRTKNAFSVLELDIDHFKDVNDQYGHQVGDEILVSLARCIRDTLRTIDSVGRIGGEEFLILLPETKGAEAVDAAERIRQHVAKAIHQTSWKDPLQITVSIGVTTFEITHSESCNKSDLLIELVKKADQAMYCAKNAGRNCSKTL
jgi:diguanylate cyclase (GGDEF)-like protein